MADKKIKKIGIDARFYGPVGKGLGRYTQEIADNVVKMDKENEYVIFLGKENYDEFLCAGERVKKVLAPVRWYGFAEQILMPYYIWKEHLDLMHFPHFNVPILCPVKFVITIHDLILTKFPTARATTLGPVLYKIKNLAYKIIIWTGVKRAKRVFAVSKFTKNDVIRQFKVKPEKVAVTYEGVAGLFSQKIAHKNSEAAGDKKIFLKYGINGPYLLYVGNAYPHKNLEGLVRVFNKIYSANAANTNSLNCKTPATLSFRTSEARRNPLKVANSENIAVFTDKGFLAAARNDKKTAFCNLQTNHVNNLRLVLVGKEDYFYKRIMKYARGLGLWEEGNKDSRVIFPGYAPDAELEILYKNALAYIFPSFFEGFGLPPLEAMSRGCPVASSNKTCLPEVLGEAAIYFNPENEKETRTQIERIIKDKNLRADLIKKGYEQVKKYSWKECARETLGVYRDVLK